jgi:diguanylate cyclase (GGDEF)-like protein/PAS domain S-box-containing protein
MDHITDALRTSSDPVAVLRTEDRVFLDVNEAFERSSGYPRAELIGYAVAELDLSVSHGVMAEILTEARASETARCSNVEFRNRAGETRRGSLCGEIIDGENDELILITVRDIRRDTSEEGLARREDFRALFENSTEGMYRTSVDGRFLQGNAAMASILGYDSVTELVEGVNDIATQIYADPHRRDELLKELRTTGRIHDAESELVGRDGQHIWVTENGWSIRNEDHTIIYFAGSVVDITARRQAEDRYRSLFENAIEGIYQTALDGRFLAANPSMARILGFDSPGDLLDEAVHVTDFYAHPEAAETVHDRLEADGAVDNFEMEARRKDGIVIWITLNARLVFDSEGEPQHYEGTFVDITEQRRALEQLRDAATRDPLTGLPNRALFIERLEAAIAGQPSSGDGYAVLFVDLDEFKVVNDSLGHLVGDELLVEVAQRLAPCTRDDEIIARHGGDEFTILITGNDCLDRAQKIAQDMLAVLAKPVHLHGHELFTNASIGIATGSAGYGNTAAVLRDADTAMYQAKDLGRGRAVLFDQTMHNRARDRLKLELDLRRAVDNDEFIVHYQPIVDLATRRLAGFEALVRWEHPERGLLPPDEFIPVADATGMTVPMGWSVLRQACRQMHIWRGRHPAVKDLYMSVNLSDKQFTYAGLLEHVERILLETDMDAQSLRFEILETVFMGDNPGISQVLGDLRELGIRLYLDDFGTQYSSLGYLSNLPIDALKIDRSFIFNMASNPRHMSLVRAILQIASDFGMTAIAEGVEDETQAAFLLEEGCPMAQGFLFAKPLPADEVEELIAAQ